MKASTLLTFTVYGAVQGNWGERSMIMNTMRFKTYFLLLFSFARLRFKTCLTIYLCLNVERDSEDDRETGLARDCTRRQLVDQCTLNLNKYSIPWWYIIQRENRKLDSWSWILFCLFEDLWNLY